jgi:glycosyltransferase involved in cell wall biosynthesis
MLVGTFDIVGKLIIHGWAKDTESSSSVKIEIYINDKFIFSLDAINDYVHLKEITNTHGPCGFAFKVPEKAFRAGLNVVRVIAKDQKICLPYLKSPTLDHLPLFITDQDFFEISKIQNIENFIKNISKNDSSLCRHLVPYLENKIDVAPEELDVLFINGLPENMSSYYRVFNIAEMLSKNNFSVFSITVESIELVETKINKIGTIVIFRCPYSTSLQKFIKKEREKGTKIIYDIDDLVFNENVIDQIDGFRRLSSEESVSYLKGVRLYRLMMNECDFVTGSTESLLSNMLEVVPNGSVVPNMLSDEAITITNKAHLAKQKRDDFVIGYYAGTATHQSDFDTVVEPLSKIFKLFPKVNLRIVGDLNVEEFKELTSYKERIQVLPKLTYKEMLYDFRNIDLCIAPLEYDNDFCDAKSELKFFEAAAAGVLVIAAANNTYKKASENGKYCYLASNSMEWFESIKKIVLKRKLIDTNSARLYVIEKYSTSNKKIDLSKIYKKASDIKKYKKITSKIKVNEVLVLIPGYMAGSGGLRKILTFSKFIAQQKDYKCTIYSVSKNILANELQLEVKNNYFDSACVFTDDLSDIQKYKTIICTHWSTADYLSQIKYESNKNILYFIQDYEPYFEPSGYNFLRAEQTYKFGFKHIYFGPWVGKKIKHELGVSGKEIKFPVDQKIYKSNRKIREIVGEFKILVYAKPSQPRRAFNLIVDIFKELSTQKNLSVFMYGDVVDETLFNIPIVNLGPVNSPEDLAKLYCSMDLGITFSTTNPSLVGYEMLACGLPIIDLLIPFSEKNYDGLKSAILLEPQPKLISKEINKIIEYKLYYSQLKIDAVANFKNIVTSETEFCQSVLQEINNISVQKIVNS